MPTSRSAWRGRCCSVSCGWPPDPRVFPRPLEPAAAFERVDAWLGHSNIRVVHEGDEHWRMLRELLSGSGTAGNLTTDAHLASLAIAHGATLVSCDADFARFTAVRWENPVRVR